MSADIQHTPGPWEPVKMNRSTVNVMVDKAGRHRCLIVSLAEGHDIVAEARAYSREEAITNARLIAAAPELLDACERMIAATEADQPFIGVEYEAMKDAVAKARGEPA